MSTSQNMGGDAVTSSENQDQSSDLLKALREDAVERKNDILEQKAILADIRRLHSTMQAQLAALPGAQPARKKRGQGCSVMPVVDMRQVTLCEYAMVLLLGHNLTFTEIAKRCGIHRASLFRSPEFEPFKRVVAALRAIRSEAKGVFHSDINESDDEL